ncbi:MAG: protein translocase subunit SecF [Proteobacteria bacterium]|nr:protein translocase subunit SecF [Pseudomonadota bacterium]MDE3208238.1 protein translocase subunit SecF [Pseudomonadota bacterium]
MELLHIKKDIPFMRYAHVTAVISLLTFVAAVFFLYTRGLNFAVDFTGGTVMQVHYDQSVNLSDIRTELAHSKLDLRDVVVQTIGNADDVLIRMRSKAGTSSSKIGDEVMGVLSQSNSGIHLRSVEYVGPEVGKELANNGALALLVVSVGIMLYLTMRFEWRFAVSGIIANLHDIVIILGMFAAFQWEFSLPVLAGVLAVLGYSVNESVIVFDRIRENFRKMRTASVPEVINNAITRTMSRTVITHAMTQTMVCAMLFFGGPPLHYFALALTIGILFGIYSSVLVASPLVLWMGVSRSDLVKSSGRKEGTA